MDFKHYKIIFFGSSEFALPALQTLIKDGWNIRAVVTLPDRPAGREAELSATPVKKLALKKKLKVLEFSNLRDASVAVELKNLKADCAVVSAYGSIIPKDILKLARLGFINVHPSLLPKYRGPSPIQTALLNGEKKTGVSLILLDEQMDHGPVLAQSEIVILEDDDYPSLLKRLSENAAEMLAKHLPHWLFGETKTVRQDEKKATFTKILTRDDGRIKWKNSASAILQQIRAFTPWPGSWTLLFGERIKILGAATAEIALGQPSGHIYVSAKKLFVSCGNKTALEILRLQPAGKPAMSAEDYLRGHSDVAGKAFQD
ncbi:MAG: methionyl-tRNA formyltransferase, partial [Patescibacteria group bacterium]